MQLRVLALSVLLASAAAAPAEAADRFRVLVFSKTTGFRHDSIGPATAAIRGLGRRHRFGVAATEDATRFTTTRLRRYDAVIFLHTTGNPLDRAAERRALQRYIDGGGGFLGIHAAADSGYDWPWYAGLVGALFLTHPAIHPDTVHIEDPTSAATRGLPGDWQRTDEWYEFRTDPRPHVHLLATVGGRPIAWCHRYRGGRSVYTAMGHTSESYAEPRFLSHLLGAIEMAAGAAPFACRHGT